MSWPHHGPGFRVTSGECDLSAGLRRVAFGGSSFLTATGLQGPYTPEGERGQSSCGHSQSATSSRARPLCTPNSCPPAAAPSCSHHFCPSVLRKPSVCCDTAVARGTQESCQEALPAQGTGTIGLPVWPPPPGRLPSSLTHSALHLPPSGSHPSGGGEPSKRKPQVPLACYSGAPHRPREDRPATRHLQSCPTGPFCSFLLPRLPLPLPAKAVPPPVHPHAAGFICLLVSWSRSTPCGLRLWDTHLRQELRPTRAHGAVDGGSRRRLDLL